MNNDFQNDLYFFRVNLFVINKHQWQTCKDIAKSTKDYDKLKSMSKKYDVKLRLITVSNQLLYLVKKMKKMQEQEYQLFDVLFAKYKTTHPQIINLLNLISDIPLMIFVNNNTNEIEEMIQKHQIKANLLQK